MEDYSCKNGREKSTPVAFWEKPGGVPAHKILFDIVSSLPNSLGVVI